MAITLGTHTNSGNQTTSSGFSFSHTLSANTKCLVVVVTGVDSSATDSVVSSVVWDSAGVNESLTQIAGGMYRVGNDFISIWYKSLPSILTSKNITVTMGGTCTDVQATAVGLIDASATTIVYDSFDTGTGTGSASSVVSPAATGSIAIGGGVADGGTAGSFSISTGTEFSSSEVDMGSQCASVGYAAEASGSATITWSYSAVTVSSLAATFKSQSSPTTVLNSPEGTYYFDGSDAAATDPNNVWTNETNTDDGDITTYASTTTSGSTASNFIKIEGTNAPASGNTIGSVRARLFSNGDVGKINEATIYTDGLAESLGVVDGQSNSTATWGSYTTLTTPSGGWTWTKIQALEVKVYQTTSAVTSNVYKIEIDVVPSGISVTPTLNFTGTDANSDQVEYQVQLNTSDTWTPESPQSVFSTAGGDGFIYLDDATWATVHDAATGSTVFTNTGQGNYVQVSYYSSVYRIVRGFLSFDLSSIPDNAIVTAVTVDTYITGSGNGDNDGQDYLGLYDSTQASASNLTTADYDQVGSTKLSDTTFDLTSIGTGYKSFPLNSTGITKVQNSLTGSATFSLREGHDAENTPLVGANADNNAQFTGSDYTGTTQDPKITVTYTFPPVNAVSTVNSGFSNPDDISDLHPWASGTDINYYVDTNTTTTANYYFNESDASATDPNGVWTSDTSAFDYDTIPSTYAQGGTAGSTSSNYLMAEGTNAPTTGNTITQVRARIYAYTFADIGTPTANAAIYTNTLAELLGTPTKSGAAGWGSYTTLSTPTGGWTWQKINDLEVKVYSTGGTAGPSTRVYKIEVEVTYGNYSLSNSTTYYWRARAIDPTGSNVYGDWSTVRSFTTGGGVETATPSPVTTTISVVTPTKSYIEVATRSVSALALTLGVAAVTASFASVRTATPDPVSLTTAIATPSASYSSTYTRTPNPLSVTLSAVTPSASYVYVGSASPNPVQMVLTPVTPSKSYVQVNTATPSAVGMTLSAITPSASYSATHNRTPDSVVTNLSVVTPSTSFSSVRTATPNPTSLTLSVVSPSSNYIQIGTANPNPLTTTLSVVTPSSSFSSVITRSPNPISLVASIQSPSTSYVEIVTRSVNPVGVSLSMVTPSASYIQINTATPSLVSMTLTQVTPTSSYVQVGTATPNPVTTTLSVVTPFSGYSQGSTANATPFVLVISVITPSTSYVQVGTAAPNPIGVSLSVVTPAKSYVQINTATPNPTSLALSVVNPSVSSLTVVTRTPNPVVLTESVVTPASSYYQVNTRTPSPVTITLSAVTPSASYAQVNTRSVDPVVTTLSVVAPSKSYVQVNTATPNPVISTLTVVQPGTSYYQGSVGSPNPVTLTITPLTPATSYIQVNITTPNPVVIALSVITPSKSYTQVNTATPNPISLATSIQSVSSSYIEIRTASPSSVGLSLSIITPDISYDLGSDIFTVIPSPIILTITVPVVTRSGTVEDFTPELIFADWRLAINIFDEYYLKL